MTQASPDPTMPVSTRTAARPGLPGTQGAQHAQGRLPLRSVALGVDASAGVARVKLEQVFHNPHAEPLRVRYQLPLPADAAVSGFTFRVGDERIVGRAVEVKAARETFERAIVEGRSAAILEESRSSLFAQELGNVPPGATVVAEILIDQPLAWIDVEGAWAWRFPLSAAPRYLGAATPNGVDASAGHTPDPARVALDVTPDALDARATLSLAIRDVLVGGRSPESPSHPLQIDATGGRLAVRLGGGGSAALDRDLVVQWPVALAAASVSWDATRTGGADGEPAELCAMLTVVPPAASAGRDGRRVARDLVVLLDTSGSMDGEPLAQAKRIACALVSSLAEGDGLELVEFSSAPRRFRAASVDATSANRRAAIAWIQGLRASGGTEMLHGITAALAGARPEAQRQVVVVTDGLIGFERDVVSAVQRHLPRGSRVHAVGVGSSTNRTLLAGIARVGGGVEVVVGLGEDAERAAQRILARTNLPVVVDLEIGGALEHAPARLPDLYAGAPARIAVRVAPEGGEIVVRGRASDGAWQARVTIPPRVEVHGGDAAAKLFARERAADLEAELSAGRDKAEVDRLLVEIGERHQIATRVTAWVATTERPTVDPTAPTRRETVPHALPFGMSAAGLGLRSVVAPPPFALHAALADADEATFEMAEDEAPSFGRAARKVPASSGARARVATGRASEGAAGAPPPAPPPASVTAAAPPPPPVPPARMSPPALPAAARPAPARSAAHAIGGATRDGEDGAKGADEGSAPGPRVVRGRWTVLGERAVAVEIDVEAAPLDLVGLALDVELFTHDGRRLVGRVRASASTREGLHAPGTTVRLVIDLDGAPDAEIASLRLTSGQGAAAIRVELAGS